jgi:hypothetical protein
LLGAITQTTGKQELTSEIFDCANRKHGLNNYLIVGAKGNVLNSGARATAAELVDVPRGSLHETVLDFVCSDAGQWTKSDRFIHLAAGAIPQANADQDYSRNRSPRGP